MNDKNQKQQAEFKRGIKAGNKLITVTNPSKEFQQRFEQLGDKQFDNLQDFIQALEATKRVNNNSIHQNKKAHLPGTDKS